MQKLTSDQMVKIQGGVTLEEYCETAIMIMENNDLSDFSIGFIHGKCGDFM